MIRKRVFFALAAGLIAGNIPTIFSCNNVIKAENIVSDEAASTESSDNEPGESAPSENAVQLQSLLEENNFYVQQGSFYELDTIKEALSNPTETWQ